MRLNEVAGGSQSACSYNTLPSSPPSFHLLQYFIEDSKTILVSASKDFGNICHNLMLMTPDERAGDEYV